MQNINRHPSHYSCMSLLGSNMVCLLNCYVCIYSLTFGIQTYSFRLITLPVQLDQECILTPLFHVDPWYVHVYVLLYLNDTKQTHCVSQIIKYGVVDKETLKKDLLDWNALYLAGRLHKPVKYLASCDDILDAQKKNIQSAMKAAMLLCPQTFNISELLSIICSLSYIGDIRLGFAEDSKKVQRIVKGSHTHLCNLYHDPIHAALEDNMISLIGPSQSVVSSRSVFRNTQSLEDKAALYAALPNNVLHTITSQKRGDAIPRSVRKHVDNELAEYLASSRYGTLALQRALASIVRKSSFRQACLGALSAGPMRSIKYVSAKIAKFINK